MPDFRYSMTVLSFSRYSKMDATFVYSGITGLIDVVYNGGTSTVMILDNDTTAMTGHQDHPATG